MMTPVEYDPGHLPSLDGLEGMVRVCLPLSYPSALRACFSES